MKINNLNLTLEWKATRLIPDAVNIIKDFASYNLKIRNEDSLMLEEHLNLNSYDKETEIIAKKIGTTPKIKYRINLSQNKIKSKYIYNFENNYQKFKEINNKLGFYKKLSFEVEFNNSYANNSIVEVEYMDLPDLNKNSLFNKIYRSNDYLNIKLMINKEYFNTQNINSFLILSTASNRIVKNKILKNLFIENVEEKWLDINQENMLLTVPFIESDIAEISENINLKIIPLNFFQKEMYKFLQNRESEAEINSLYQEYFPNQCFNIGKVYKQNVNNETIAFYQNYIYLFNKDSLQTNALGTDLNINDIVFNSYLPLLNKDQTNKTICLSDDLNTDDVLDNNYNVQKDYLGYYSKNLTDYEDIAIDVDYLQNQGIKSVKILEIEELSSTCNIYIEFITSFYGSEKFYIETSNNLKFHEKYKTIIDSQEYITLLFKYSYDLNSLNEYLSENSNINKNQIISEKDLINFSAKLIL
jgi:hypothetical protein